MPSPELNPLPGLFNLINGTVKGQMIELLSPASLEETEAPGGVQ